MEMHELMDKFQDDLNKKQQVPESIPEKPRIDIEEDDYPFDEEDTE